MKKLQSILFIAAAAQLNAQDCPLTSLTETNSWESICFFENTPTAKADALNRPYLYVASMEGGFKVVSLEDTPQLLVTIETSEFENLQVTNLSQVGNFVYLSIGHQPILGTNEGGLAIVDVTEPENAFLTDYYVVPNSTSGAGCVEVVENIAYLGAMQSGIVVLDVSDENDIQFISQFIPDVNFPSPNPDASELLKINARGMTIENNIIFLCYDAGGFRTIDATDPANLQPMDEYSNPALDALPRAYNNVVLDEGYAYITADYCGLEVLNVNDPQNITAVSWWNPWDCTNGLDAWATSAGHTNEIVMDKECDVLFIADGKSDMHVVDVTDPFAPDSCSIFGGTENQIGTWGISMRGDSLFLAYICTFIPFSSNWTGIKILEYETTCDISVAESSALNISVFPNPATNILYTKSPFPIANSTIYDSCGRMIEYITVGSKWNEIDINDIAPGLYSIKIQTEKNISTHLFQKQ